ncbi:NUDIX hydrolase [Virgibacillus kekensis]|uniref:NUDIX hydrolase n=1 Tax=Virgibacillus kekensis TaxID=202261 RepID=A0ABV9DPS0_9BACI
MKRLVKVLAVKEEEIVLIEQFRKQLNRNTVELPGGKIESGETPTEAAKRELREETGIIADEFSSLRSYINNDGTVEVNLFFTNKIERVEEQKLDHDESIVVQHYPSQLVLENIFTNKWDDIRLGIAFLIARKNGLLR